jgi:hypothetical protein
VSSCRRPRGARRSGRHAPALLGRSRCARHARDPSPRGVRRTGRGIGGARGGRRGAGTGGRAGSVGDHRRARRGAGRARRAGQGVPPRRRRRRDARIARLPGCLARRQRAGRSRSGRRSPDRRLAAGRRDGPAHCQRHRGHLGAGAGGGGGVDAVGAARTGRRGLRRRSAELRPRTALGDVDVRGRRHPACPDPDRGDDRADPRSRVARRIRRSGRGGALVPRRRGGTRTRAPPIRQADRAVPRREASPGRHAGPTRAVGGRDLGRGHLGRRGLRSGGRPGRCVPSPHGSPCRGPVGD